MALMFKLLHNLETIVFGVPTLALGHSHICQVFSQWMSKTSGVTRMRREA